MGAHVTATEAADALADGRLLDGLIGLGSKAAGRPPALRQLLRSRIRAGGGDEAAAGAVADLRALATVV